MNEKLSPAELFWISVTILLGIFIYGHSLNNGFIWDDSLYVGRNPLITSSWAGLKDIWFRTTIAEYYPVTTSVTGIEYKLWGLHPWGYHVVSFMLHTLNALLLFSLLHKRLPRLAGIVTLLFMIHPIQVETVAWISEQKNLLCLFFFLWALHGFLDFEKSHKTADYMKTFLFFAAALLSKSVAICFAFIPLLYAWWKQGSLRKRDFLIALPFFVTGGIIALFHIHLVHIFDIPVQIPSPSLTWAQKICLAGQIFFFYIRQILFPQSFMTLYPKWSLAENSINAWFYPAGVAILYFILFWKRRELGRWPFALLCLYGIPLLPTLGLIDFAWYRFSYVADHFTFLSLPFMLLLFCSAVSMMFLKIHNGPAFKARWISLFLKTSLLTAAVAAIAYLSILSSRLTLNYKDEIALWTQNLRLNPNSSFAYFHLANICRNNPICTPDQTIFLYEQSTRLKPDHLHAQVLLAECYKDRQRFREAQDAYERALLLAKPFVKIRCYRGMSDTYLMQGELDKALLYLEKAMAIESDQEYQKERRTLPDAIPQEAATRRDLGALYLMRGENTKAVRSFQEAISLNPGQPDAYAGLGASLMNLKDHMNAIKSFQKALELDPESTSTQTNLAEAQARLRSSGPT